MDKKQKTILIIICSIIVAIVCYTQFTIFVIPPIGAIPEGKTLVILRLNKTNFVDSPDAMCERLQGGVSLLCRGVMIGAVINKSKILMRLPYSKTLYLISTKGKIYSH